jgi:AraC-like DNA-binding protein
MKNLLIVCLILSSFSLFAQKKESKDEKKQRIEAARVSFITKKLELTPEESKEFWPVINEMETKIKTSRKALKDRFKKMKQEDEKIDEKTYQKLIEDMHEQQISILEIKNEYVQKIASIIGYEKTFRFEHQIQREFKKQLMDRMKKGHVNSVKKN